MRVLASAVAAQLSESERGGVEGDKVTVAGAPHRSCLTEIRHKFEPQRLAETELSFARDRNADLIILDVIGQLSFSSSRPSVLRVDFVSYISARCFRRLGPAARHRVRWAPSC
jgi:hypothetical protein